MKLQEDATWLVTGWARSSRLLRAKGTARDRVGAMIFQRFLLSSISVSPSLFFPFIFLCYLISFLLSLRSTRVH